MLASLEHRFPQARNLLCYRVLGLLKICCGARYERLGAVPQS